MSRSLLFATCAITLLAAGCGGSTTSGGAPGPASNDSGAPKTVKTDGGRPTTVKNDSGVSSTGSGDSGVHSTGSSDGGVSSAGNCPAAPTVVAANQNYPGSIVADNQYVYWIAFPDPTDSLSELLRAPADACNTKPSVFVSPGQVASPTLDADSVFWCDANGIESRPKAGGPTTLLSKGKGCPRFADATDVFLTSPAGIEKLDLASHQRSVLYSTTDTVLGLAAHGQSVYFVAGDTVWQVPRAGGAATAVATKQLTPSAVAVNATGVYWVDAGNTGVDTFTGGGSLMGMPLAGGAPRALATDLVGPTSLAVDASHAFTAGQPIEAESIPLLRVPLAGGTPVTLVPAMSGGPGGPGGRVVAVNDTAVYYVTRDSVNRVAKSYSP